jgi:hypothetical protein
MVFFSLDSKSESVRFLKEGAIDLFPLGSMSVSYSFLPIFECGHMVPVWGCTSSGTTELGGNEGEEEN